jgi:hypothetical protein
MGTIMGMKLYVDDLRRCPDGWKLARTITDAIGHLYNGRVDEISLDHDIVFVRGSDIRMHKEAFMTVAYFMAVMPEALRPSKVRIHTANVDAGWKIHDLLRKAGYQDITVVPLGDDVLSEDIENLKRDL